MELACSVNQDASNPGSIQGASGTFTAGAPQADDITLVVARRT